MPTTSASIFSFDKSVAPKKCLWCKRLTCNYQVVTAFNVNLGFDEPGSIMCHQCKKDGVGIRGYYSAEHDSSNPDNVDNVNNITTSSTLYIAD